MSGPASRARSWTWSARSARQSDASPIFGSSTLPKNCVRNINTSPKRTSGNCGWRGSRPRSIPLRTAWATGSDRHDRSPGTWVDVAVRASVGCPFSGGRKMVADTPRLNGVIRALEQGQPSFVTFAAAEIGAAQAINAAAYDGVVFEMEHRAYDIRA